MAQDESVNPEKPAKESERKMPFIAASMSIFADKIVLRSIEGKTKEFQIADGFKKNLLIELSGR